MRNGSIGSISYENGVVKLDGVPLSEVMGENVGGDYSLKGTENAQEIAALKRENETLRERVDYWKSQTRCSDGVRTDSKSVEKAAKELTRRYGAEIEGSEIAGDLANLYDYIARGGDETGELTCEIKQGTDDLKETVEPIYSDEGKESIAPEVTLQSGETVGAADSLFLITKYLDKRGRYCFRMDEILDPETVSSVAVFGEMFSVES